MRFPSRLIPQGGRLADGQVLGCRMATAFRRMGWMGAFDVGRGRDPVVDLVAGLTSVSFVESIGFGQNRVIAGYNTNLGFGLFVFHGWGTLGHGNASVVGL